MLASIFVIFVVFLHLLNIGHLTMTTEPSHAGLKLSFESQRDSRVSRAHGTQMNIQEDGYGANMCVLAMGEL